MKRTLVVLGMGGMLLVGLVAGALFTRSARADDVTRKDNAPTNERYKLYFVEKANSSILAIRMNIETGDIAYLRSDGRLVDASNSIAYMRPNGHLYDSNDNKVD